MPWADIDRVAGLVISVKPGDQVVAAWLGRDLHRRGDRLLGDRFRPSPDAALASSGTMSPVPGIQRLAMSPDASIEDSTGMTDVHRCNELRWRPCPGWRARSRTGSSSEVLPSRRHTGSRATEPPSASGSISAADAASPACSGWPGQPSPATRIQHRGRSKRSRVTLDITVEPTRPVDDGRVARGSRKGARAGSRRRGRRRSEGSSLARRFIAAASRPLQPVPMRDEHGIASLTRIGQPRRLVVRPDAPPTVAVRGIERTGTKSNPAGHGDHGLRRPADDVAVDSVEQLHYAIRRGGSIEANEPESGHRDVTATGLGTRAARGVAALPLAVPLGRESRATRSSYRLRVADNRPAPQGPERHPGRLHEGADGRGRRRADR